MELEAFNMSPPPNVFLDPTPSNGRTREQHISTNGRTREQHNSNKWQNNETKCWPMTTKQTLRSGNQTLKLHHVQTLMLSKARRKTGAEDSIHLRRKEVIYKEPWTPWEVTQSVSILHRLTLKPRALSQGKEDEKSHGAQFNKSPTTQRAK